MHQRQVCSMLIAAAAMVLVATMAGRAQPAPPPAQAALPAAARTPAGQAASYVGEATCLTCHEDQKKGYSDGAHGRASNPRAAAAGKGCESCHGPGSIHVETAEPGSIQAFRADAPRAGSEACLTCHRRGDHALWDGSAHAARNLSCTTCHSVHDADSPTASLRAASEEATCTECHRVPAAKMQRVSHMPVAEGKMTCSSCHNVHGSTNVRLLRAGNWINESCASCHADKRGPFLFEHAAGRESCVSCHDPHGSSNDRMLVARMPMLCQRCHIGTRHPSTIYDMNAVRSNSNRVIGRSCVNCHQNIHGSNHPSGQNFLR